jgi:hypothetical protein
MAFGGEQATNYLSIFLIAREVPRDSLLYGTIKPEKENFMSTPILSDADFKSYDWTDHVFTIKAEAARRLFNERAKLRKSGAPIRRVADKTVYGFGGQDTPFLLVASGEPIYVGVFSSPLSSASYDLPTVWLAPESMSLPIGSTNDYRFIITTVKHFPTTPGATNAWIDMRSDKRIFAALEKLSIQTNAPPATNVPAKP